MTDFTSIRNDPARLQAEIDKRTKYIKQYEAGAAPSGFGETQYSTFVNDIAQLRELQTAFIYPEQSSEVVVTGYASASVNPSAALVGSYGLPVNQSIKEPLTPQEQLQQETQQEATNLFNIQASPSYGATAAGQGTTPVSNSNLYTGAYPEGKPSTFTPGGTIYPSSDFSSSGKLSQNPFIVIQGENKLVGSLDYAKMQIDNKLSSGSVLQSVGVGVAAGAAISFVKPFAAVGMDILPFNQYGLKIPLAQTAKSTIEMVSNPVETVTTVAKGLVTSPVNTAAELAGSYYALQGAGVVVGKTATTLKDANKISSSDVLAGTYNAAPGAFSVKEATPLMLQKQGVTPGTGGGGTEFTTIPQLTVDISATNKRQRYFSEPEKDVPRDRQFTLGGTEVTPPTNPPGVLPLNEKPVTPLESNPITIKAEQQKPGSYDPYSNTFTKQGDNLVSADSSALSRNIDKPTAFNDPVLYDIKKDDFALKIQDTTKQTALFNSPAKPKPAGNVLEELYGNTNPITDRISQSKATNTPISPSGGSPSEVNTGTTTGGVGGTASLAQLQQYEAVFRRGGGKTITVESDYKYNALTGEYQKRIYDTVIGQDIAPGGTTRLSFGVVSPSSVSIPAIEEKTIMPYAVVSLKKPGTVARPQPSQIQETNPRTVTAIQSSIKQPILETTPEGKAKVFVNTGQTPQPVSIVESALEQKGVLRLEQVQEQQQIQLQQTQQRTININRQKIGQETRTAKDYSPFRPRTKQPTTPGFPIVNNTKSRYNENVGVQVRREGKFKTIAQGVSLAEAVGLGTRIVQSTAARTFKITGVAPNEITGINSNIYTTRGNVFIQKSKFAISSPGEKEEITYKGIRTKKAKSIFRRRRK